MCKNVEAWMVSIPYPLMTGVIWAILLLLLAPTGADPVAHSVVDGCDAMTTTEPTSGNVVQLVTQADGGTVRFSNCKLPSTRNYVLAVRSSSTNAVLVEIHNTTMNGGSFTVVPHGSQSMEDVQIAVKDSTLHAAGHVLVVTTSNGGSLPVATDGIVVNNVAINIVNSQLSSTTGSVASIIAGNGAVNGSSILVRDNCNLQGKYLVASVVTNKLMNSALILTVSSCSNVTMVAGATNHKGNAGVLSVIPTMQTTGCFLNLQNVQLMVLRHSLSCDAAAVSSTTIKLEAIVSQGAAATLGVVLKHPTDEAKLVVSAGEVSIRVQLIDDDERNSGESGEVVKTTPQHVIMSAKASTTFSATATAAIVLFAKNAAASKAVCSVASGASLRISLQANHSGTVRLSASSNGYSVASVLGVAVFSYVDKGTTNVAFSAVGANVTMLLAAVHCDSVSLTSSSWPATRGASSVLGIVVYDHTNKASISSISLDESTVTIVSYLIKCRAAAFSSSIHDYGGTTVLGMVLSAVTPFSTTTTSRVINVQDSSRLQLVSTMKDCDSVSIQSITRGAGHSAASLLGVALFSHGYPVSTEGKLHVIGASTVQIASIATGCRSVLMAIAGEKHLLAAAVMGVAVRTHHGTSTLTIGRTSSVTINAQLRGDVAVTNGDPQIASSAMTTMGILVFGTHGANTRIIAESGIPAPLNIQIWLGATEKATVAATGSPSLVLGMFSSKPFSGVTKENTAITLCRDTTATVTAGVAVTTSPLISGVANQTTLWKPTVPLDNDPAPLPVSLWCSRRAQSLIESVELVTAKAIPTPVEVDLQSPKTPTISSGRSTSRTGTMSLSDPHSASSSHQHSASRSSSISVLPPPRTTSPTTTGRQSSTLSRSVTLTIQHVSSDAPIPPTPTNITTATPPPANKRKPQITSSVLMPDNEAAATVVLSGAGASSAMASAIGSSGGGVLVTAGASVRMMECGLAEDDPRPAMFELPIQFPVGSGSMRYFAGAALGHTVLHVSLFAIPLFRRRTNDDGSKKLIKYLSLFFCGAHPFFTPAILGACSAVLNNDSDGVGVAVSGLCALVMITLHCSLILAIHRGPRHGIVALPVPSRDDGGAQGGRLKLEFTVVENGHRLLNAEEKDQVADVAPPFQNNNLLFSGQATKELLLTLFDGCRVYEKASHRHYTSVEVTLFSIIAIVSGARPQENCSAAAFAIGALAALQLVYVVAIRPFRTKLDTIFSFLNGLVLVVLCGTVAISLQKRRSDEDAPPEPWALRTLEVCLWGVSGFGFVQLLVQGYWAYHVLQRRQHQRVDDESSSGSSSSDSSENDDAMNIAVDENAEPLLRPVEMEEKQTRVRNTREELPAQNPLR